MKTSKEENSKFAIQVGVLSKGQFLGEEELF